MTSSWACFGQIANPHFGRIPVCHCEESLLERDDEAIQRFDRPGVPGEQDRETGSPSSFGKAMDNWLRAARRNDR
jgi:hypothetical protein